MGRVFEVRFDEGVVDAAVTHLRADARARGFKRADSIDSEFVARQLHQVMSRAQTVDYPDLVGRDVVPVQHELNPGATSYSYIQYDIEGDVEIGSSDANDSPSVDLKTTEFGGKVFEMKTSYKYSIKELMAAAFAMMGGGDMSLDQRKANAAKEITERTFDKLLAVGRSQNSLYGILNLPSAQSYTVPPGESGHQAWSTKTPQEIYADFVGMYTQVVNSTLGVERPDCWILPPDQDVLIETTPWAMSNASNLSIKDYILKSRPGFRIFSWARAAGAGAGGLDRTVMYKNHPDKVFAQIPQEFTQYPVQFRDLNMVVPCMAQFAGVVGAKPEGNIQGDGI